MNRFLTIKKIANLLDLGFYFKCIMENNDIIYFHSEDGIFYIIIDKYFEYPLEKDTEDIAEIIYSSKEYVFSNSKDMLTFLMNE